MTRSPVTPATVFEPLPLHFAADNVWLVDDCANTVTKADRDGKRLMVLLPNGVVLHDPAAMEAAAGREHAPAVPAFAGGLFNRPTDVAVAPPAGKTT